MFTQLCIKRSMPLIFTLCALVACDTDEFEPRDAEEAVDAEEDAVRPAELVAGDEVAEQADDADVDAPGDVEMDIPTEDRSNCASKCAGYAFCFWEQPSCTGTRIAFAGGTEFDFQIRRRLHVLLQADRHREDGAPPRHPVPSRWVRAASMSLALPYYRAQWGKNCPWLRAARRSRRRA
ncbi:MAG: hypothetical protein IPK80_14790 [Nannocystis sp.]|nr:hypothetical protein [Nannocystis sp.]